MSLVTPRKGYKSVPWLFGKEIEIPEEWRFQKIRECCNILDSKRIPINSEERKKIQGNIPYYGANGIQGYVNDHIFDEEIILLAEDGGYFEEYKTRHIAQYVIGKSWVNNHAHVLNSKKNILLKWVFYSLVHKNITQYINGSTRTKLNQSDLQQISILIPPLSEQQKIASILSNVDNLIESTGKVITHSKKVKTGLMQKLLTRGIGHTKFKKVPWLFGKEIEIPEEWENVNVEYVADKLLSGGTPSTMITEYWDGDIPWTKGAVLTTNNTTNGERFISELGLKNSSTSIISKDNLLVVSRVSIGNISINKIDVAINQDITAVILNKTICLTDFLYWNLLQTISILVSFSQGTTIQGFTRKDLSSHKVLLPSLPEQQKISSILSNIDSKITSQEQYKEKLEKLKKSLMQKLLTGEVRV